MAFNAIIIDDKIKELLAKIDSGDDKAKATLGDYYNTLGVQYFSSNEEDNVEKSIYCFEESSKLNDENGKKNLAILYNQLRKLMLTVIQSKSVKVKSVTVQLN